MSDRSSAQRPRLCRGGAGPGSVGLLLAAALAVSAGCKDDAPKRERSEPLSYEEVQAGQAGDIAEVPRARYARDLAEQLDLVPEGAKDYAVVRDLRPVLEQGRRIEAVMAGPLSRAVSALGPLLEGGADSNEDGSEDDGAGLARLEARLERSRATLSLLLAGLDSSGVSLDQGMVVADLGGTPTLIFAASGLERVSALASLLGEEGAALVEGCGPLVDRPGWFACSTGGAEGLAAYRPGGRGGALMQALAAELPGVELEAMNAVLAVESAGEGDGGGHGEGQAETFVAALRTDPGLWELSVPMPARPGEGQEESASILAVGPAPALRALVPGTSFAWARLDPVAAASLIPMGAMQGVDQLTGEAFFGVLDEPDALVVQVGLRDASAGAQAVMAVAPMLPGAPVDAGPIPGLEMSFDRAPIELDTKLVPAVGVALSGDAAPAWAATLGVPLRGRLWAYGEYASAVLGDVEAAPVTLGRLRGSGPSPEALKALPPTLARALLDGEVAALAHLVLDDWQVPPTEAELGDYFARMRSGEGEGEGEADGRGEDPEPVALQLAAAFQALAPWSSVDLWLRGVPGSAGEADRRWVIQVTVVPFDSARDPGEREAARAALHAVLAKGGDEPYTQLLARFSSSERAQAYRARAGEAPRHHGAAGMLEMSALVAVGLPFYEVFSQQAKTREPGEETQRMISAALATRERAGSCEPLVGEAGPTPSLELACHEAPGGRCQARAGEKPGEKGPGSYPLELWSEGLWAKLDYAPLGAGALGHRFHYSFAATASPGPKGEDECHFVARAQGDLDGDGEHRVYERELIVRADGSQVAPAMKVSGDVED